MKSVKFPKKENQHYYRYHYTFLLNVLKEAWVDVQLCPSTELDTTRFTIKVKGEDICIDFSDHTVLHPDHTKFKHYFKYHYTEGLHEKYSHIFPLSPISFLDWKEYFNLESKIKYTCNNDIILNNQRIFGNAIGRRTSVKIILKTRYGKLYDNELTDQVTYWKKANNCLLSVHVPGARNDMLDRAQYQMMAFGVCTISPYLKDVFPHNATLQPGYHYIECKPDYSDLSEKIEWCKKNREKCIQIGKHAKNFFVAFCLPRVIVRWVEMCLTK